MTGPPAMDFERQVLEALRTVPGKHYDSHAHFLLDTEGERFEYWLRAAAPRIVAACRATRHATYWQCARSLDVVDHAAIDQAAISVLRGATPAEGVER